MDVGGGLFGLLAASAVAFWPSSEAVATRIEYYATVADPPCELNFARSGLGYCDVGLGSGEAVPFGELINVSTIYATPALNSNITPTHTLKVPNLYQ